MIFFYDSLINKKLKRTAFISYVNIQKFSSVHLYLSFFYKLIISFTRDVLK